MWRLIDLANKLCNKEDIDLLHNAIEIIDSSVIISHEGTYARAINYFGKSSQIIMAMEEMSELTKELSKDVRKCGDYEHIAEEIADVEIMLGQLKIIYDIAYKVEEWKAYKVDRLEGRMK